MAAYDQVLAKLSNISSVPEEPREKRYRKDDNTKDPAAIIQDTCMAAAEGKAAGSSEKRKKRKKEICDAAGATGASVEKPLVIVVSEDPKGSGKSRHSARFARRRAGKNVRG